MVSGYTTLHHNAPEEQCVGKTWNTQRGMKMGSELTPFLDISLALPAAVRELTMTTTQD